MGSQTLTQRCGLVVKELIRGADMDVAAFSEHVSFSKITLYRYTSGVRKMPLEALEECCARLGVSTADVVAAAETLRYDATTGRPLFDMPAETAA